MPQTESQLPSKREEEIYHFFLPRVIEMQLASGQESREVMRRDIPRVPPRWLGGPPAGVLVGIPSDLIRSRGSPT
jgi:hypothetical protein